MQNPNRREVLRIAAASAAASSSWVQAQSTWPIKPVTLIVPFVPVLNRPTAFDPSAIIADFVWSETRSSWSTALFDAENSSVGVPEHHMEHLNFSQNYPNPASDFTVFNFEVDKSQQVLLEV